MSGYRGEQVSPLIRNRTSVVQVVSQHYDNQAALCEERLNGIVTVHSGHGMHGPAESKVGGYAVISDIKYDAGGNRVAWRDANQTVFRTCLDANAEVIGINCLSGDSGDLMHLRVLSRNCLGQPTETVDHQLQHFVAPGRTQRSEYAPISVYVRYDSLGHAISEKQAVMLHRQEPSRRRSSHFGRSRSIRHEKIRPDWSDRNNTPRRCGMASRTSENALGVTGTDNGDAQC